MMKSDIRCAVCPMMLMTCRAKRTDNSYHLGSPRGKCYCQHPDAEVTFRLVCSKSGRMPGFIAFTKGGSDKPNIKTAPRWCPRRLAITPIEINSQEAREIIDSRRPHGLFYLKEGNGYTGIDNQDGNAWTEEFATKAECLKWLNPEGGKDDEAEERRTD